MPTRAHAPLAALFLVWVEEPSTASIPVGPIPVGPIPVGPSFEAGLREPRWN